MAVPKRRKSRSRTRSRRSQWKATAVDLTSVSVGGTVLRVPSRVVNAVRRGLIDPDKL
ncbi:50S ribosomal protein L32 [Hoyosella rhizosphaerae]|uniref:Large ribosomal subunit protein bL32 n=1 Tax=Hoyosella rhizosphaerae TaxID=1755582 RepID=A0A916UDJ7_9ACTN|nr:50S ribosomal protein L32 [Hoyosella rhizosphaerae]MBN4925789.1 50S ribosomal protein L32 [Hoyosella rhizosphaerae]GGC67936.1 50S ribosomal protein L32 [Hoyosella rhizosphaerae]